MRPITIFILLLLGLPILSPAQAPANDEQEQAPPACHELLKVGQTQFGLYDQDPKNIDHALAAFAEAALNPACSFEASWRSAEVYLCWGQVQAEKKKKIEHYELGMAQAKKAIALAPDRPEGHHFLAVNLGSIVETGGVIRNMGKVKSLRRSMQKALEADPDFAPALVVQAEFLMDLPGLFGGDDDQAQGLLLRALAADPECDTVYTSLAKFYFKEKQYPDALELLDRLESRPAAAHSCPACYLTIDLIKAKELRRKINEKIK